MCRKAEMKIAVWTSIEGILPHMKLKKMFFLNCKPGLPGRPVDVTLQTGQHPS
jgi:hypothetical protein